MRAKVAELIKDTVLAPELGKSPKTLRNWRVAGFGPPFLKVGKNVMYDRRDVDDWLRAQRRFSTSQRG